MFLGSESPVTSWVTVKRRLDRLEPPLRLNSLKALIVESSSLDLAAAAAVECFAQNEPKGTEDELGNKRQWVSPEVGAQVCEAWSKRALPLLSDQKIIPESLREVYRTARFVCPQMLPEIAKNFLSSDAGIDRLARILGRTGVMSPGGTYVSVHDDQISDLGDVALVRARAASRLKKLSSKADIALKSALQSIATGKAYFTTTGKEART